MTVSLLNCLHISRCDLLHVWNSWKHTYSSALRCIKEGRSMWLCGCCLVSTDSLHEPATCILLFMCFVSSGSFQTGSTYWVESAVRRSGPGRRQQPHYELLLHPNLASSQQQGERVQKPEWQEDITKTFEWVRYPVFTVMGPQKPLTMPECLLFNKSGILGKSSYYNCGNVVLLW